MRRAIPRGGVPLSVGVAVCLLLGGCPDPPPPGPPGSPSPGASASRAPREAPPPWVLIPPSRVAALEWTLLTEVAEWPDPSGLTPLDEAAPARQPSPAKTEALLSLTRSLLRPDLVAPRPTLGLDVADRLHLPLAHGELRGSATLDAHATGFPTVTVAFQTGARAASSVAELRQQVADVLNDDLRAELSRDDHALYPHSGVPSAGLAQLDTAAGYGLQFPFLYAYSGRDSLVLVFQEIPHETEGE